MSLPPISLDDVARLPAPGMAFPVKFAFSPDDRLVTYLHAEPGSLVRQLYAFDPSTGEAGLLLAPPGGGATEENLSLEEKLRRERQRQRDLGVTTYSWAPVGERLLAPFPDGLYVLDRPGAQAPEGGRLLVSSADGPVLDPQFSPDGAWVAFVRGGELHVVSVEGGEPLQLTYGAAETGRTHGLAEFVAQEEMGRSQGYWWSPDAQWLAFEEVDETHIPVYRIMHQGKDFTGEGAQEDHRYPFAGQRNAVVRLGVVSREGGEPAWLDLGADPDIYLARVGWLPDGSLAVQRENREQTHLDLLRFDPGSGECRALLAEESEIWINLHDLFRPLKQGAYAGGFLWGSERTGFRHLYLYDGLGRLVRPLTQGDWLVESLAGVDEERGLVYFTATKESPLETHLYAVPLEGGEPRKITAQPGGHAVTLDHACRRFVDVHDSLTQPPRVTLRSLEDGAELAVIYEPADERVERLALRPPEIVTLTNRTGETLYGALYRPPAEYGPGPYPTLVYVYGGPHVQLVANRWTVTAQMRAQRYARQGILVFMLDNRGSARRGLAFEGAIKHHMGGAEVDDQVDGVRWLVEQGLADPARVGIHGWSYGGFMSLMCLFRAPEVFKCAIAGAPVTDMAGYDTHYTERYLGLPAKNPEGYRLSSPLTFAEQMQGRLMLVHGLIDENVHFRHTARLINALIQARKTYDLLLFPDERHGPRRPADRVYLEEQMENFLKREL